MGKKQQKNDIIWWVSDDLEESLKEYEKYRNIELTEEDIAIGDAIFKDVLD